MVKLAACLMEMMGTGAPFSSVGVTTASRSLVAIVPSVEFRKSTAVSPLMLTWVRLTVPTDVTSSAILTSRSQSLPSAVMRKPLFIMSVAVR